MDKTELKRYDRLKVDLRKQIDAHESIAIQINDPNNPISQLEYAEARAMVRAYKDAFGMLMEAFEL